MVTSILLSASLLHCVGDDPNIGLSANSNDASSVGPPDGPGGQSGDSGSNPSIDGSDAAAAGGPINGKAQDRTGAGVANIKVRLAGAVTTTAADGTFSFPFAPATYTLDVGGQLTSYRGLTTRSPIVRVAAPGTPLANYTFATNSASLDAGGSEVALIGFIGTEFVNSSTEGSVAGTGTISWNGPSAINGFFFSFVQGSVSGKPYLRGRPSIVPIALNEGQQASVTFAFVDAPLTAVSGSNVIPGTPSAELLTWHDTTVPPAGFEDIVEVVNPTAPFTMPTVVYNGGTWDVGLVVNQSNPNETIIAYLNGLTGSEANLLFTYGHTAVHLGAPPNNATGVSSTSTFSWSSAGEGSYLAEVFCAGYSAIIYTTETSATLPDSTGLGAPAYPASTGCTWTVTSYPTVALDSFVGDAAAHAHTRSTPQSSFRNIAFSSR